MTSIRCAESVEQEPVQCGRLADVTQGAYTKQLEEDPVFRNPEALGGMLAGFAVVVGVRVRVVSTSIQERLMHPPVEECTF